jgi:hypothetical protein
LIQELALGQPKVSVYIAGQPDHCHLYLSTNKEDSFNYYIPKSNHFHPISTPEFYQHFEIEHFSLIGFSSLQIFIKNQKFCHLFSVPARQSHFPKKDDFDYCLKFSKYQEVNICIKNAFMFLN